MEIHIIGIRAYPAHFVGTSGVEFYCDHLLQFLTRNSKNHFHLYTRKKYQATQSLPAHITVEPLATVSSKVLETLWYCLVASCRAATSPAEIVWYQGVGPSVFAWIPKLFGKKIVMTVHSLDWQRKKWSYVEQKLFYLATFFIFNIPDKITVVSQKLKAQVLEKYRIDSLYTPPGLLTPAISKKTYSTKEKYILYLGRIVPEKRVDWLLQAFSEYKKHHSNEVKLCIAGGHGNHPEYEVTLKKQYQHPDINWLGYVFGKEKEQLLQGCMGFVLPSELEGNSISVLEAISVKKKIVVADSILEKELSKLPFIYEFETESYEAFQATVEKLINASQQNIPYELSQDILKKYSWKNTAQLYTRLFTSISIED